jgi:hypothetical protein
MLTYRVAVSGASATIASDALMNPFDGESCPSRSARNILADSGFSDQAKDADTTLCI